MQSAGNTIINYDAVMQETDRLTESIISREETGVSFVLNIELQKDHENFRQKMGLVGKLTLQEVEITLELLRDNQKKSKLQKFKKRPGRPKKVDNQHKEIYNHSTIDKYLKK